MTTEFPKDNLTRYYHLIKILEKLVEKIDLEFKNDLRWYLFSLRLSRKLLFHCKSFCLHSADTLFDEDIQKETENAYVDVSGLFSNLRFQMDCYSTLHHIFFDDVDWETKRIRFDLWRYDSFVERINLNLGSENDFNQLEELRVSIETNHYFKSLEETEQKVIFDHSKHFSNWKFFTSRLTKKDARIKWTELFQNTGINITELNKAYGFLSMYVHSNFFSVGHLTEMNKSEANQARVFAITFSSFIICFTIDDLISKFIPGKDFLKQMNERDYEIIKSFIVKGREPEKNKNFT